MYVRFTINYNTVSEKKKTGHLADLSFWNILLYKKLCVRACVFLCAHIAVPDVNVFGDVATKRNKFFFF